ncbi:MAG: C2 family cysteine protease, partial [archaeon]|nr:C2 family cysteine protease [archaeon]
AITGFPTEKLKNDPNDKMKKKKKIKKAGEKGHLMSCGSKQTENVTKFDLVQGHAYTLLAGKDWPEKDINLLQIRNPWGLDAENGEWTGDWSDKDTKHWTPEAKKHFGYVNKNDGIFYMDLDNYIKFFDDTFICHIFYGANIKTYFIDSDTQLKLPIVFNIKIKEERKFSICAKFKGERFNRELHNTLHPFSMLLFKYNEQREIEGFFGKHCGTKDDAIVEKLTPGNYVLWVFCSHNECIMNDPYFNYKLCFYSKSDYEVECVGVDQNFSLIKHLMIENFKREEVGAAKIKSKKDVFVGPDDKAFKESGIKAYLMYNKTDRWAKVEISGITDDIHMMPPFEGKKNFVIMVPPQGENCLLGIRAKKKISSSFTQMETSFPETDLEIPEKENFDNFMLMNISSKHDSSQIRNNAMKFVSKEKAEKFNPKDFDPAEIMKKSTCKLMTDPSAFKKDYPFEIKYLEEHFPPTSKEVMHWDKIPGEGGTFIGQRTFPGFELRRGIFIWKETQSKFIGYFANGAPNGKGAKFDQQNNLICEGNFVNGKLEGRGRMYNSDTAYFEGDFKDGVLNGKGEYHFEDGAIWEGEFKNNMKHGVGNIKIPNSNKIVVASFENDALIFKQELNLAAKLAGQKVEKGNISNTNFLSKLVKTKKSKQDALVQIVEDNTKIDKQVVWIDPNNDQKENMSYAAKIKHEYPGMPFHLVKTVEEGYKLLAKDEFKFKLVHVIMSGSMSPEFMENFENIMKKLKIATANIIFCGNYKYWNSQPYSNDAFKNPGKVVTEFDDVKKYIMEDQTNFEEILKQPRTAPKDNSPFGNPYIIKKINNLEDIAFPLLFPFLMETNRVSKQSRKKFQEFIYSLGDPKVSKLVNPSQEKKVVLPNYILSKFFLRMFAMESPFSREMNKDLSNDLFDNYRTFFYILYNAEVNGLLENYTKGELFAGRLIEKKIYEQIVSGLEEAEKNDTITLTNKSFAVFSPNEAVANNFLGHYLTNPRKGLMPLKLILSPPKKISPQLMPFVAINLAAKEYSLYPDEDNVVLLPFASFKITGVRTEKVKGAEVAVIELEYLEDILKKILKTVQSMGKGEKKEFMDAVWESEIAAELNSSKVKDDLVTGLKQALYDLEL